MEDTVFVQTNHSIYIKEKNKHIKILNRKKVSDKFLRTDRFYKLLTEERSSDSKSKGSGQV